MFPSEGYFYVKSQKNGLFVSVDGEDEAGSKLVTGPKGDDDSQLWSYENGYLVSKQTAMVMDIEGGDLKSDKRVLQFNRKKTMTHNQRWGIRDGFVYVVADPRLVLDTQEDEGSYITVAVKKSEENDLQQWYLEPYEGDC
ncbi:uncharacterized protein EV154DRAFT_62178 [Mucor mucedo]|uniref:uncharacterized protein n=1 Tax=Mucor mucedo TaxID=29922 RepID=UPI00221ED8E2|nr:uncharacterized protein EV154DRAFT_62178 [Mucor mucedo]KAI7877326.1 hypothetical protein EV154DRAFT_62178 [Mucor mucedo]